MKTGIIAIHAIKGVAISKNPNVIPKRLSFDKADRCVGCASVLEGKEGVSGAATADGNPEEPRGSKRECFDHVCCRLERMNSDVERNSACRSCIGMESSNAWISIIMWLSLGCISSIKAGAYVLALLIALISQHCVAGLSSRSARVMPCALSETESGNS